VSDEKRERFHLIAVSPTTGSAWEVDPTMADSGLMALPEARIEPDLQTAYRLGAEKLRETTREAVGAFRAASLHLLEEEVRRIFGYFDRTIEEIQAADPDGSQDLLRAVRGERDRRLAETLERFDPKARASLCAIRAIHVPTALLRLRLPHGRGIAATVDAWSRRVHGLACDVCHGIDGPWIPHAGAVRCARCPPTPAESVRPRGRPRSDTPRRGTRDGRGSAGRPGRPPSRRTRARASSRTRGPSSAGSSRRRTPSRSGSRRRGPRPRPTRSGGRGPPPAPGLGGPRSRPSGRGTGRGVRRPRRRFPRRGARGPAGRGIGFRRGPPPRACGSCPRPWTSCTGGCGTSGRIPPSGGGCTGMSVRRRRGGRRP